MTGPVLPPVTVDVLICTFRRPQVAETLRSVDAQRLPAGLGLRVVVMDNDGTGSGRVPVLTAARDMQIPVRYLRTGGGNISTARNALLDEAQSGWVAFLDDDEVASPHWLSSLWRCATATGADAVFGPVLSVYPPGTPDWIRQLDLHSSRPVRRAGVVETGIAGNVLLRCDDPRWSGERFDVGRGRTGGEDTEFFFRLHRLGARFEIADDADVHEPVSPDRLGFRWLARRRYRMGQSYAARASGRAERLRLGAGAAAKATACGGMTGLHALSRARRAAWALRAALHLGVVAGALSLPQRVSYGGDASGQDPDPGATTRPPAPARRGRGPDPG
ncbi:glycosyltransferase [Wenxinia saemankumensis]|uniref:Succinoglycan biosynthesis protein ExoM n=1 Tax=Wenxinia saemankumensis TaxID=1447782 RepID=A0A1M5ZYN8_9RHOB|nr:glycosyltransferase family 2 protein [Wenxinia saemankumensis]SHI29342.1 succinoglycan biosynthesis protein ExoM [Wenxinia saemankumensis]